MSATWHDQGHHLHGMNLTDHYFYGATQRDALKALAKWLKGQPDVMVQHVTFDFNEDQVGAADPVHEMYVTVTDWNES